VNLGSPVPHWFSSSSFTGKEHFETSGTNFLWVGCPSCHSSNSVKELNLNVKRMQSSYQLSVNNNPRFRSTIKLNVHCTKMDSPHTTVLRPFFWDHPGEPVPEENFWTLWCKGRLTEADTPTIRMGATPSGLVTSALLHHPLHCTKMDSLL